MLPRKILNVAAAAAFSVLSTLSTQGQITLPTVFIGNPSNPADPTTGYGAVPYTYNIGATEVTNAQYAAFLNAVARTDTNGLYNINMLGSNFFGGIDRVGQSGSYTYIPLGERSNNPVNWVSFWDATRFANWLHNGQPTGLQNSSTTEDGAYTLTPGGITSNAVTRDQGWQWAVCSENEWYKAAYHQPAGQGGDSDSYWLYPTSRNTISTTQADYDNVVGNTVPAGSYAANFYGAFDMGGNLWEWDEGIIDVHFRGLRGGSFVSSDAVLRSDHRNMNNPLYEDYNMGFRVSQVPGPSSTVLLSVAWLAAARRRRS